jgi:hypothetical protein
MAFNGSYKGVHFCLISHFLKFHSFYFSRLDIIGKFPTKEDCEKFQVKEGKMTWVPTTDGLEWFQGYALREAPASTSA